MQGIEVIRPAFCTDHYDRLVGGELERRMEMWRTARRLLAYFHNQSPVSCFCCLHFLSSCFLPAYFSQTLTLSSEGAPSQGHSDLHVDKSPLSLSEPPLWPLLSPLNTLPGSRDTTRAVAAFPSVFSCLFFLCPTNHPILWLLRLSLCQGLQTHTFRFLKCQPHKYRMERGEDEIGCNSNVYKKYLGEFNWLICHSQIQINNVLRHFFFKSTQVSMLLLEV